MNQTDALRAWLLRGFFLGRYAEQLALHVRLGLPIDDALKAWDEALIGLSNASLEAWGKPVDLPWQGWPPLGPLEELPS